MRNDATRRLTSCLVATAALAVGAATAKAVDVTECGQVVPRRQVGVLVADLDCSDPNSYDKFAIVIEPRGTLNLNDFSLIGPGPPVATAGISCSESCRVNGPGTIIGFRDGIQGGIRPLKVTGVSIVGAWEVGIIGSRLIIRECTISGTGKRGVVGLNYRLKYVRLIDSSVSDRVEVGITGPKVMLDNVTVTGNGGDGVRVYDRGKLRARDSAIVGNGFDCPPDTRPNGRCFDIRVSSASGSGRASLRNTIYDTCYGKCQSR